MASLRVIFVAESPEPVEDPDGKVRWRVDTSCVPAALTGLARPNANRVLNGLVGDLLERGTARGRSAHFTSR
ncbi:MAG: hypothetical protein GEV12_17850 [Micromonosporaceae bacterium]|nr:hypothetical protein [Micromonosporaceae bacterium]